MRFKFCLFSFIIKIMETMLTISAIEPQKKRKERYNIYADGEYVASLGAQALVSFHLRVGSQIDHDTLQEAVMQDNVQYAFDSAAAMLARKMRTRSEIEARLKERGINPDAIETALKKLEGYGYVDDIAFAREFVQSIVAAGRWGRRAAKYKLKEKGLGQDVIEAAMALYTDEDETRAARQQAQALLYRHAGADKRKQRQKVYAALARHGFDYSIITSLLSEDEF